MENQITENFAKSIVEYDADTHKDIRELRLNTIVNSSLLQNIPYIKTLYGIAKVGFAVREKYMLSKSQKFVEYINSHNKDNKRFEKYKEELKKNDKTRLEELERVLVTIDRYNDKNKVDILGNLFINYISENISWNDFIELTTIVENVFVRDLDELEKIYKNGELITMNQITDNISFKRLKNQLLFDDIPTSIRNNDGSISHYYNKYDFQITVLGIKLYKYGIKG